MYHQLARTDRYRWWKPLVELVVFLLLVVALWLATIPVLYALVGPAQNGAPGLIKLGLTIAVAIPAAFLAARILGRRWGALLSVEGRFRGRWFAICVAVAFANIALSTVLGSVLDSGPSRGGWIGWDAFVPLAITVLLVIPLQATAEELAFRGTLLQALGAWVRPPWFAIAVTSIAFGLAHDLPIQGFVAIAAFGGVAAWLTIKTGGLEAAIAMHVVNNVTLFLVDAATGRSDRWITALNTEITWLGTAFDVAFNVLYGAVIAKLWSRRVLALRDRAVEPVSRLDG